MNATRQTTAIDILHHARCQVEVGSYAFAVLIHAECYLCDDLRLVEDARIKYAQEVRQRPDFDLRAGRDGELLILVDGKFCWQPPLAIVRKCKVCGKSIQVGHPSDPEPLCNRCVAWGGKAGRIVQGSRLREEAMKILRENLLVALHTAIKAQEIIERKMGYTGDSAMLAGWREMLESLQRGEYFDVR